MKLKTEIFFDIDSEYWDDLLKKQKFSTAFQAADYYKPNQLIRDCKPFYIIVKNEKDVVVGQLSGLIDFKYPQADFNKITKILIDKFGLGSRIIWDHGPIIHDNENRSEICSEILTIIEQLAAENKIDMIRGSSCPLDLEFSDMDFLNFDYQCKNWMTYILDLTKDRDTLFANLHKKIRYDIRKAESGGLIFEIAEKQTELEEFAELKFKLKNKYSPEKYDNKQKKGSWDYWYKKGIRKLFLVRYKTQLIGGINTNIFNGNLYQTSVINTKKEFQGGTFLTWKTIEWAQKMNNLTIDLGGANPKPNSIKEEGINFYKEKWGGQKFHQTLLLKMRNKNRKKITTILTEPKSISSKIKNIVKKK